MNTPFFPAGVKGAHSHIFMFMVLLDGQSAGNCQGRQVLPSLALTKTDPLLLLQTDP
jgi:hypothetical protein